VGDFENVGLGNKQTSRRKKHAKWRRICKLWTYLWIICCCPCN